MVDLRVGAVGMIFFKEDGTCRLAQSLKPTTNADTKDTFQNLEWSFLDDLAGAESTGEEVSTDSGAGVHTGHGGE